MNAFFLNFIRSQAQFKNSLKMEKNVWLASEASIA